MRSIIIGLLLMLGTYEVSAQYLPIMGPNGPVDICVDKPAPSNTPVGRALAKNPDFACPVQMSCSEQKSPAGAQRVIIEVD